MSIGQYLSVKPFESIIRSRRSDFEMTEITVRVLGPSDLTPTPQNYRDQVSPRSPTKPEQVTLTTYSKRQNEGFRKSKRIRQVREYGKRHKITITKAMSVKELKVMVSRIAFAAAARPHQVFL